MMERSFYAGNRARLMETAAPGTLVMFFSDEEIRKSADANYLFYADRNFVYLTGIEQKESVLMLGKDEEGHVWERLYLLPKDAMAERWTGRRLSAEEADAISGIREVRTTLELESDLGERKQKYRRIGLDLSKCSPSDRDKPGHMLAKKLADADVFDISPAVRALRTIKQLCEIEALRKAEQITKDGILAMMRASRPGMYEYQYKAEFDRAIGQYGPKGPGFQSIISAGENNFCIHYDAYTGQAKDGDMVLNDVGAQWDNLIVDVSRGWPCNGKFTDRQKLLYNCALKTSDHLFSILRPGMKMADVDRTIREYNASLLVDAGVMESANQVGTYMWHGGAHHIGFDVHDQVVTPEVLEPGMVFCVDVGIYHEAWGIGFRLEDNCLITETGCENLSASIPRTIEEIESIMAK